MPDLPISASAVGGRDHTTTDPEPSTSTDRPAALVIDVAASLDLSTIDRFRCEFRALFDEVVREGFASGDLIVVDLSGTDFVSIDATAALVEAKDVAGRRGIEFKLVTTTRGVERALTATGARNLLTCCPTVESAVGTDPIDSVPRPPRHREPRAVR
ncbi:STAS domain-containing protein [Prescottella agglutinans]|uniref:STAS domain-containing protein n=1 Tax=Prescottella agglutinans TaxID=1644129 RepID=UPI003D9821CA